MCELLCVSVVFGCLCDNHVIQLLTSDCCRPITTVPSSPVQGVANEIMRVFGERLVLCNVGAPLPSQAGWSRLLCVM